MCGDSRFWVVFFAEPVVSVIGDDNSRFFWVDGSKGKVLLLVRTSGAIVVYLTHGGVTKTAFRDSLEER